MSATPRRRAWRRMRRSGARGATVVEVAILAPIVILAVVFVSWAGAQTSGEADTMAAARAAARAAALAPDQGSAVSQGEAAGLAATDSSSCALSVDVDTTEWFQGWVTATATCSPVGAAASLGSGSAIERTWTEAVTQRGLLPR